MNQSPLRIVLTGGPCAGKTTIINFLKEELMARGFAVFTVTETATEVHTMGIDLGHENQHVLQVNILNLQLLKESLVMRLATSEPKQRVVVLHDRGAMDALAYMSKDDFRSVLFYAHAGKTEMLHRYDAVLHLVSTAVDAPEIYTLANNAARTETIEKAKSVDFRTMNAWVGTPHLRIFDNLGGFEEKKRKVLSEVCNLLGVPSPLEIEIKWLVDANSARRFLARPGSTIVVNMPIMQVYLKDGSRIRMRGAESTKFFSHTVKTELRPGVSIEEERSITEEEFNILLARKADPLGKPIEKIRHMFIWNNRYWELDEFTMVGGPFFVMETELSTDEAHLVTTDKDKKSNVDTPPFLRMLRDVTLDTAFKNKTMAFQGTPAFRGINVTSSK